MKTAAMISITVNGAAHEAASSETLGELVQRLGVDPCTVIVEHNGIALRKNEWAERAIESGDRIEFIRIVAGG